MNINNPPALVVLCTAQGSNKESDLSSATWTLPDVLTPPDNQNYAALVSLTSFQFANMFQNIHDTRGAPNNILKTLTIWSENLVVKTRIDTLTITPGHYTITDLLSTINTAMAIQDGGFWYGIKLSIATHNGGKLHYKAPTSMANLGNRTDAHKYISFNLLLDDDTEPLLSTLGLIRSDLDTGEYTNVASLTASHVGVGSSVTASAEGQPYTETFGSGLNVFNMSSQSLLVQWEGQRTESRVSTFGLQRGDTLAVVPSLGDYGQLQNYEPHIPFKTVITNFNPATFTISVKGAADGLPWDFHGVDWTAVLTIEYVEINMDQESSGAASGEYITRHPHLHNTLADHNLPFSGNLKRQRHNW